MIRRAKIAFLFTCKYLGLFRLARHLTRKRLKILCYHGFELRDEASFRPRLFIRISEFSRRMATVKDGGYRVLPLDEAVERLYAGTLPDNAMAITIDDGFLSFAKAGVPILAQHGFPATLYATTYYINKRRPIFRLVVQYMFWKTNRRTLTLDQFPGCPTGTFDLSDRRTTEMLMWKCIDFGEHCGSEEQRVAICKTLAALLNVPYEPIESSGILSLLAPEQLADLVKEGIRVELHTHRHRFPLDDEQQAKREIEDNRVALSSCVPGRFRHFCYPSGVWDQRQWSWLGTLDVSSATTCIPGLNDRSTPRYQLRRQLDGHSVHQLEFEAAICGFSALLRNPIPRRPSAVP